jgi:outer membrane biogenesis lipoprotein LolB
MRLSTLIALLLACVLLQSCSLTRLANENQIDCTKPAVRCHEGRFGLSYQITRDGAVEQDAINGSYLWESENPSRFQTSERSHLVLSNVLGGRLAEIRQEYGTLTLKDNAGNLYLSDNWDSLFNGLFKLNLPGSAIASWMHNAKADELPALPANWVWEKKPGRLRLSSRNSDGFIRIDLIPNSDTP